MKEIELDIVDYGYDGEGVAKKDGKVFFVPKTIIGEKVKARVIKERAKFSFCQVQEIIEKSDERQIAPCPYYDKCGGCNFQHISRLKELELKKSRIKRELSKVCEIFNIDIVSGEKEYGYRNKIRFKVKGKKLGFYEEKSNNFIEIKKCLLIDEKMNVLLEKINCFLQKSDYSFDEVIMHRIGEKLLVDFISKEKVQLTKLEKEFEDVLLCHKGEGLWGEEFGLRYKFVGDMFRQVNDEVAKRLYYEVLEEAKGKNIINAFSGAGLLSGVLAQKAEKVHGIELNENAHKSAEELKKNNDINNLANICGYVEREIDKIEDKIDCIVLDPPRAGCDKKVIDYILTKGIEKIIYVSCNPATLVRDLTHLMREYEIKKVKAFDMFPRTANVESLAILTRKSLTKKLLKSIIIKKERR